MSIYFKESNGFRFVKVLNDTIGGAELIEVNLYEFNTSIEFRKMEAHLTDCLPCTAEEFSEAILKAKQFIELHLIPQTGNNDLKKQLEGIFKENIERGTSPEKFASMYMTDMEESFSKGYKEALGVDRLLFVDMPKYLECLSKHGFRKHTQP